MQITYRWYRFGASKRFSAKSLVKKLKDTRSESSWFAPAGPNDADSELRYFRVSEVLLEQYETDGTKFYNSARVVSSVGITLLEAKNDFVLRVVDPGRNMRSLVAAIEQTIGFGFWITPIEFDSSALMRLFGKVDIKKIVGLKIKDVVANESWVGRMEFASKQGIDIDRLKFLKAMRYQHEWVKFELIHKASRGYAAVSSGGLVKTGGDLAPLVRDSVEKEALKVSREA